MKNVWQKIICGSEGEYPKGRETHTTIVGNKLYLIGGNTNQPETCCKDIYTFDFQTKTWQKLITKNKSPQRRLHSVVLYEDKLFLFGGANPEYAGMSDLFFLDLKSNTWHEVDCEGDVISGRCGHSANLYMDSMIVFGGIEEASGYLNDCYVLSLRNFIWKKVSYEGDLPKRVLHSSCIVDDDLFIFGGCVHEEISCCDDLRRINLKQWKCELVLTSVDCPSPRRSSVLHFHGDSLILFGGARGDEVTFVNEVYVLNLKRMEWKKIKTDRDGMQHTYQIVGLKDSTIYCFPAEEKEDLKELYVLQIPHPFSLSLKMWKCLKAAKFCDVVFI